MLLSRRSLLAGWNSWDSFATTIRNSHYAWRAAARRRLYKACCVRIERRVIVSQSITHMRAQFFGYRSSPAALTYVNRSEGPVGVSIDCAFQTRCASQIKDPRSRAAV
jgi:hypothetical protein